MKNLKKGIPIVVSTLLLLFLVSGIYYLFQLPQIKSQKALIAARSKVAGTRLLLVDHRGVVTQYIGLNPHLVIFPFERRQLLQRLDESISEMEKVLQEEFEFERSVFVQSRVKEVLSDKDKEYQNIREKASDMVETQKKMIEVLGSIDNQFGKIYEYEPLQNLGDLSFAEDVEFGKEAIVTTKRGINDAAEGFRELDINTLESREFFETVSQINTTLDTITDNLDSGEIDKAENLKILFINEYPSIKEAAFNIELSIFESDTAVESLKELTRTIAELEGLEQRLKEAYP
jgi:hypothetical protein